MSSTNKFMEKENMIVPAVLRGRSVSEINLKGLEQDQDENFLELEDEFLKRVHPNDKSNIKQGISIFSFKTVSNFMAKLYSKKWECRKDGISEIRSRLGDGTVPPTPDCMDCIIFILQQILRDSLHSYYFRKNRTFPVVHHRLYGKVKSFVLMRLCCPTDFIDADRVIRRNPQIFPFFTVIQLARSSTTLLCLFGSSATHDALALKAGDAINPINITWEGSYCLKKFILHIYICKVTDFFFHFLPIARAYLIRFLEPSDGNGRRLKGRAKIIDVAATIFKLPDNEVALTDKSVTSFCTQCMGHSDLLVSRKLPLTNKEINSNITAYFSITNKPLNMSYILLALCSYFFND
uniref:ANK_REP_REGION domain-containing protein n=1 Tax=Heterorhabditis bacteriophora TaxID=37862 RepID=A0A1I7X5H1_HETBA